VIAPSIKSVKENNNMIQKIEQTLDVVVPFVILVLSVFDLTGVINIVDKAIPIIYGLLAAVQSIFKIWGIVLRHKQVNYPVK
jgi:hypothetical protein